MASSEWGWRPSRSPYSPFATPYSRWWARYALPIYGGCVSNPPIPEIVVALDVGRQERAVVRPAFVLRQLDLLLRVGVALALVDRLLHGGGEVLQVGELVLRVLLGAGLHAARAGMAGNQRLPVHRDHLLQALLDVGHVGVRHAAELDALDRDPVDREDDLLLRQPHHQ